MALFSRLLPRSSIRFLSGKKISVRNSLYQERERSVAQEMKERCYHQTEILQGFETGKNKRKNFTNAVEITSIIRVCRWLEMEGEISRHWTKQSAFFTGLLRAPWLRINRNRGLYRAHTCTIPLVTAFKLHSVCIASLAFRTLLLTLQRGVTGTARMLHALTHSSISRQVREQM